jgi:hypothetical protein
VSSNFETADSLSPAERAVAWIREQLSFMPTMQQVEVSLGLLAGSGLLLWEPLGVAWSVASPVLVAHVVVGSVLALGVIAPFCIRHRRRLHASSRARMRWTGRAIELSLALLGGSGAYLLVVGNRGDLSGRIAVALHIALTLPLVALVVGHRIPWSRARSLWRTLRAGRARPQRSTV